MNTKERKQVQVTQVDEVTITARLSDPPQFIIEAKGMASTPGFTDPQLVPYMYVMPPEDGIWDFDFVATPPSGMVPQVLTTISAVHALGQIGSDMKGVRVHAQTNSKEAMLQPDAQANAQSH